MKVIDLLNKMANGEEVPEKIKVGNIIYIYESWEHFYYTDNEEREDLLVRGKDYSTIDFLNWNVELIEDETTDVDNIEEFKIDENNYIQTELGAFKTRKMDIAFLNKINSIIRWAKQKEKEIKELKSLNIEICEKDINKAIKKAREQRNKSIKEK